MLVVASFLKCVSIETVSKIISVIHAKKIFSTPYEKKLINTFLGFARKVFFQSFAMIFSVNIDDVFFLTSWKFFGTDLRKVTGFRQLV